MKKKTVITTEKLEVWIIPQPSEIPADVAQAPETEGWESEPGNESIMSLPEERPAESAPPTHED